MAKKKSKKDVMATAPMVDKKWQAESDARTLMDAKVILKDKKRLTAAQSAAKKLASEKIKEADAMNAVAEKLHSDLANDRQKKK